MQNIRKGCQIGMRTLYKEGRKHRFKKEQVEQAFKEGWLSFSDYKKKGGKYAC